MRRRLGDGDTHFPAQRHQQTGHQKQQPYKTTGGLPRAIIRLPRRRWHLNDALVGTPDQRLALLSETTVADVAR
ncbi:MAG: hypothetical protein OXB92_12245 [Acidimicrobiaceae bacterium]|nr:hypothetical protein [Acidimicrobiia bacterium]MCY4494616.1 hypothetical protein [Acidimicrobiaceae bacterium]